MLLKKRLPGGALGYKWKYAGEVIEVPDEDAVKFYQFPQGEYEFDQQQLLEVDPGDLEEEEDDDSETEDAGQSEVTNAFGDMHEALEASSATKRRGRPPKIR